MLVLLGIFDCECAWRFEYVKYEYTHSGSVLKASRVAVLLRLGDMLSTWLAMALMLVSAITYQTYTVNGKRDTHTLLCEIELLEMYISTSSYLEQLQTSDVTNLVFDIQM